MKVLHLFKTYLPDSFTGIERVIFEIAESTCRLGVESHVLALSKRPHRAPMAVANHTVHQVRQDLHVASTGLSRSAFARFAALAANVDVIHYHFPWPMADALHFRAGRGKPTVLTYHSDIVRQRLLLRFYRPVKHRFLGAVDHIVATSPNYLATSPVLARFRNKTSVIPIGLASVPAVDPERVAAWRQRLGERFFLFVGVLRYYKGLPVLVEAARRTGLPLAVVGEGPLRRDLERAGLPNVTMLGKVDEQDKLALLSACTAFVFPSSIRTEAFGVALAEAARAGKPMISCEIGTGTSYVNRHEETGLVVPPDDPGALGLAMQRLWNDPELSNRMGRAAAVRFNALFRAEDMGMAYADLYARVMERRRTVVGPSAAGFAIP